MSAIQPGDWVTVEHHGAHFAVVLYSFAESGHSVVIYATSSRCRYASEPSGWEKVLGANEELREARLPLLGSGVALAKTSVPVRFPNSDVTQFEIGFDYDCINCNVEKKIQKIVVRVNKN